MARTISFSDMRGFIDHVEFLPDHPNRIILNEAAIRNAGYTIEEVIEWIARRTSLLGDGASCETITE
jgi:hypothetical protein